MQRGCQNARAPISLMIFHRNINLIEHTFSIVQILITRSVQNLAHYPTAVLSMQMQTDIELQQDEFCSGLDEQAKILSEMVTS